MHKTFALRPNHYESSKLKIKYDPLNPIMDIDSNLISS
jgi:hypothetical protein